MLYTNLISQEDLESLTSMITRLDFPWYYQPNIAYSFAGDTVAVDPMSIKSFGLTHTIWDAEKGKVSEMLAYVTPVIEKFVELSGVKINNWLRIKINLQTPIVGNAPDKYNGAHVDRYIPHKTLIFYPFDSDGDTFIFNEIYNPDDPTTYPPLVNPTIKERIKPVANTLCYLEDGYIYHTSSNPITCDARYTINFNFN